MFIGSFLLSYFFAVDVLYFCRPSMAPTLVAFLVLITHCLVSPTQGQSQQNQACQPTQCPPGSSWDSIMCGCVIPDVSSTMGPQDASNTASAPVMSNIAAPQLANRQSYFGFDPTFLALSGESELLTNALLMGGGRLSSAPVPSTSQGASNPSQGAPSQQPFGTQFSNVSPYLFGNGDLVETMALHNLVSRRNGGKMGLAYALSQGSDAMRNAIMMNSLYPSNGLSRSMMLLRGNDAARDLYILNSLNKGNSGRQGNYMNTLGATGALGENYQDMMATRAILQETNPVKQIMLSKMLDVPDSTQRWITLKAYQAQRPTGRQGQAMLY